MKGRSATFQTLFLEFYFAIEMQQNNDQNDQKNYIDYMRQNNISKIEIWLK